MHCYPVKDCWILALLPEATVLCKGKVEHATILPFSTACFSPSLFHAFLCSESPREISDGLRMTLGTGCSEKFDFYYITISHSI